MPVPNIDFAISYAGEDESVAREITTRLREYGFEVFFAADARSLLVGADGEELFEWLFKEAKEVVVLISKAYKSKDWTRFEWDVIRERLTRFIAVRLDDTKILGLPSKLFYQRYNGANIDEIVDICIQRLLLYEREQGIHRPSEYECILEAITNESKGAVAQAYQLVMDKRKRDPLADIEVPDDAFKPTYRVFKEDWSNFSVVRRRGTKIAVPRGLSADELRFNLKHAATTQFNAFKPDAVMVFAYVERGFETGSEGLYSAGRAILAPFGRWDKAEDGVAYNLPATEFEYSIDLAPEYFNNETERNT